ncbi:MAG TPA: FAD:protein FMN transferase [Firmicutes bacterium]|nr:FAD:protein FMN transferase [Bacillota bacterium]
MKKTRRYLFLTACIILLLISGCQLSSVPYQKDFFAMDTYMSVLVYGNNAEQAADACVTEIQRLDTLLDKNDPKSDIFRLNHAQGAMIPIEPETEDLLSLARTYAKQTSGKFDPTINAVSELWAIGSERERVPPGAELSQALRKVGYENLVLSRGQAQLKDGATVDLGGIAKGYAADRAVQILREYGIEHAVLSLGGNVYVLGSAPNGQPWNIGIQDPDDKQDIIATLSLSNCSAVTSGDYERYFEQDGIRYHHIFDPKTGYPGNSGVRSVTIICESSTQADAYSTALFLMGMEQGIEFYHQQGGFEAVFVLEDGSVQCTDGISDSIMHRE